VSREAALSERLDAFLARRGTTRDALVAAIDEPFGPPLLVVAAGSVLHGFGNERSDVDVHVVVDRDVSRLPIGSYAHTVLVDTKYFSASEVERWVSAIRDEPWPPLRRLDRSAWERRQAEIINCSRFAYGLVLRAHDSWSRWLATAREPWLAARVSQWWQIESIRREVAARWLADAKPLLAAVRVFESVLAALESRAAAAGQSHYGPKWLSEKLRALNDRCGLDALRAVMRVPSNDRDAADYMARCATILDTVRTAHAGRLAAQLWYLPGVRVHELDGRTLVSRWNLRGVELSARMPPATTPREPIWQGSLDISPPPGVLPLFVEDMTWLSIVTEAA
jgi:predicted nucleotidyltransferase